MVVRPGLPAVQHDVVAFGDSAHELNSLAGVVESHAFEVLDERLRVRLVRLEVAGRHAGSGQGRSAFIPEPMTFALVTPGPTAASTRPRRAGRCRSAGSAPSVDVPAASVAAEPVGLDGSPS